MLALSRSACVLERRCIWTVRVSKESTGLGQETLNWVLTSIIFVDYFLVGVPFGGLIHFVPRPDGIEYFLAGSEL